MTTYRVVSNGHLRHMLCLHAPRTDVLRFEPGSAGAREVLWCTEDALRGAIDDLCGSGDPDAETLGYQLRAELENAEAGPTVGRVIVRDGQFAAQEVPA